MNNRERNGRFAKKQRVGMWLVGLAILGLILFAYTSGYVDRNYVTEYVKVPMEVVVEKTPEWAQDPDAVEAAQAVIKKKELEAQLSALETDREALVAEHKQKLAELDAQIASTSDELALY